MEWFDAEYETRPFGSEWRSRYEFDLEREIEYMEWIAYAMEVIYIEED